MYEIVVRAIIRNKQGDVLLAKRAKEPERHKWALVGGKVEVNEKTEDAIKREVKEELSISFNPTFQSYGENLFTNPPLHCLILYFSGTYSGKVRIKHDELLEVRYFTHQEIEQERNIAWDHKQMLLSYLLQTDKHL